VRHEPQQLVLVQVLAPVLVLVLVLVPLCSGQLRLYFQLERRLSLVEDQLTQALRWPSAAERP